MNQLATPGPPSGALCRLRLEASGTVQGVGFRPQVYRTALDLGLTGWVQNNGHGVSIEVEGARSTEFAARLRASLPPLAHLDALEEHRIPPRGEPGFSIIESATGSARTGLPADVGICSQCLKELFDRDNRRYLHPFIACCDCGPRYSMAQGLPYDRATTSMGRFDLCEQCAGEYTDSHSRRLHAEPIACHDCGPRLSHSISDIATALSAGHIVAIKGIGGYHLACDARNANAVSRLRRRKQRDARPFAVMFLNSRSVASQVEVNDESAALMQSAQRPIVVANRHSGFDLPDALAPDLGTLGIMLPYTPLHYLLFHTLLGYPEGDDWIAEHADVALVMTSANLSGEPMLTDDAQADSVLGGIADLIVTHDRVISHGCDDSVLRATRTRATMIRRGRGFAPGALSLASTVPTVIGLGAHLKNTVCVLREKQAFVSSHIGDLQSPGTQALHRSNASELLDWLQVEPQAIACDLHPDYASTRFAQQLSDELSLPLISVQHHHAHIASMQATQAQRGPVLGLALDGHGLGDDGESWGGELLRVEGARFKRLGHLRPLALPGGDRAAREPWRLALAMARSLGRDNALQRLQHEPLYEAVRQLGASPACPVTTSCGRYFDTAAAILGLCDHAAFEASAAMLLESRCQSPQGESGTYEINNGVLDLNGVFDRLFDCTSPEQGATLFHTSLIQALTDLVCQAAEATGIRTVALAGGCFLNTHLATVLPLQLKKHGLTVWHDWSVVTPGDGAISLGQAWVAAQALNATTPLTDATSNKD